MLDGLGDCQDGRERELGDGGAGTNVHGPPALPEHARHVVHEAPRHPGAPHFMPLSVSPLSPPTVLSRRVYLLPSLCVYIYIYISPSCRLSPLPSFLFIFTLAVFESSNSSLLPMLLPLLLLMLLKTRGENLG